jgi:hypothetical protein
MMETRNAVITDAVIGINDAGFLEAWITLKYSPTSQVFSCVLYTPMRGTNEKNYAGHFIHRILEVAGAREWEQLKGKAVRAKGDHTHVEAVGHIIENVWLDLGEEFGRTNSEVSA